MATRTKIGILSETLAGLNPWWRTETWAAADRDLVRVRNSGLGYEADVLRDLQPGGLYVLRGPRRVGKTVASKQAIARLIDAGIPRLAIVRYAADGMSESDLRSLVQRVALPSPPPGVNRWWFLDEITGATGEWPATKKKAVARLIYAGIPCFPFVGSAADEISERALPHDVKTWDP